MNWLTKEDLTIQYIYNINSLFQEPNEEEKKLNWERDWKDAQGKKREKERPLSVGKLHGGFFCFAKKVEKQQVEQK